MSENISKVLDKIENKLKWQQEKLKLMRKNPSCIEYWVDCGDGGLWLPFTDKVAFKEDNWDIDELRLNIWYLVKTDTGIRLLRKEEYETYMGETHILYQGSYQACKDFIKVDNPTYKGAEQ